MNDVSTSTWRLETRDRNLIAALRVRSVDMPWVEADVLVGPAWDQYAELLAAESRVIKRAIEADDWTEADRLYEQLRRVSVLFDPAGVAVAEYLLHVEDGFARWRWHDEPFGT